METKKWLKLTSKLRTFSLLFRYSNFSLTQWIVEPLLVLNFKVLLKPYTALFSYIENYYLIKEEIKHSNGLLVLVFKGFVKVLKLLNLPKNLF